MRNAAPFTVAGALLIAAAAADPSAACSPSTSPLGSPRAGSHEVQAKALNDRGDVVGFSDGRDGSDHAILWKGGKVSRAVDLGVPRGYVSSEAYGVNNHRVVFGLLYDKRGRTFPFRWAKGRTKVLRDPSGRVRPIDVPDSNAINDRGQIAATLLTGRAQHAVRWSPRGKAELLPGLPGHTWTLAWGINSAGVVSGWSRRLPRHDGENNPVTWTPARKVVALATAPGRADGSAMGTTRTGLSVGYLGNLGTEADPESDQAAVWTAPGAQPLLLGPAGPLAYAELVDVNERGQAIGMQGTFTEDGFTVARPAIWTAGWPGLRTLPAPAKARRHRVHVTQLADINRHGMIVGNAYGLSGKGYDKLERIYATVWTCSFG